MGVVNTIDLEVFRNKLSQIAGHSQEGFSVQEDIDRWMNWLQQSQVQTSINLQSIMREKFISLVDANFKLGQDISWALSCVQMQTESLLKEIMLSLSFKIWPKVLMVEAGSRVTSFAMSHIASWDINIGKCTFDSCEIHALTPWEGTTTLFFQAVNIGSLIKGYVYFPDITYTHVFWNKTYWQPVNLDKCNHPQQNVLCMPYQLTSKDCWMDSNECSITVTSVEGTSKIFYLGQGRICFHLNKSQNVTYRDSVQEYFIFLHNGTWCTNQSVVSLSTEGMNLTVPTIKNVSYDITWTKFIRELDPGILQLQMTEHFRDWLVDFNVSMHLEKQLKDFAEMTHVKVTYDTTKITNIVGHLRKDSQLSWWESLFGMSPTASAIMNIMIHSIIIIIVYIVLIIVIVYIIYRSRKLFAKISLLSAKTKLRV
ncbi:hypothetical protein XENTR_v10024544 [Xenopus tropicalis]|nr:hypothetical protein XENTR_v10024544 [Xenopus tropicalis]